MPSVLYIEYNNNTQFCRLSHPYNKRFIDWLRTGVRPTTYRTYNDSTRQWSVHLHRLPVVVSMGRRYFDHVDYSSLPENIQIQLVKNIENYDKYRPTIPFSAPRPTGPHAVLFVLETAPWEVVEAAYKAMALLTHPDRGGRTEDFQVIQHAFDELKKNKKG